MKLRNENLCDGLSSVRVPEKPEWEDVMKTSRNEVKGIHERNEKRMNRMLMFEMESLQKYLEVTSGDSAHQELQNVRSIYRLSEDEASRIDADCLETMTLLEARQITCFPIDKDSDKLFKYKAIISEFREFLEEMKTSEHQKIQNSKPSEKLMKLDMEKMVLDEKKASGEILEYLVRISKINIKQYVYQHELVEKQLELDEYLKKFLDATRRKKMADLMRMKYFPEGLEDRAYLELIKEFLSDNCSDNMTQLLNVVDC